MTHAPAAGAHPDDIEFDVPVLQLPAMAGERSTATAPLPHVEAGAAGMLQVQTIESLEVDRKNRNISPVCSHTHDLQVMGPASLASAAPSEVGSLGSEWGRAYEDEDTWYDFSSVYQSGPDTHLLPARDSSK